MSKEKVKVIIEEGVVLPKYAQLFDSGMDVRCHAKTIDEIKVFSQDANILDIPGVGFQIPPGGRVLIPSGLKVAIRAGYEIQVRSRSGLALKKGLIVVQGIGTIDSTYRGPLGICIANISNDYQVIEWGERIAQLVLTKVEAFDWQQVGELTKTDRGSGGFGSTGNQ